MPDRFEVLSLAEFMAQPTQITSRDLEAAYRKGYQQGYAAAAEDAGRLVRYGYTRLREICNFLNQHAGVLYTTWRMAYVFRRKSEYLPPALKVLRWQELRQNIVERDGHRCVFCFATEDLHVDHIEQVQHGGVASESNLRVLCASCNLARNGHARAE